MKQKSSEKILDQALEIPVIPIIKSIFPAVPVSACVSGRSCGVGCGGVGTALIHQSLGLGKFELRHLQTTTQYTCYAQCHYALRTKKTSKLNSRSWSLGLREAFEVSAASSQSSVMLGQRRHLTCPNTKTHDRMASHGILKSIAILSSATK